MNNKHDLRISEEFLAFIKSDLKMLRKKSKHNTTSQLIRYSLIESITKVYGEKWLFDDKNSQIPEVVEYKNRQRNNDRKLDDLRSQIKKYQEKRKQGTTDFQLGLFTEN